MSHYILSPQGAYAVNLGGLGVVFRLSGADTQGSFTVVEHPLQPYTLASPIHTHSHEDEYSYILEGEVMVMIGDEVYSVHPGDRCEQPHRALADRRSGSACEGN